MHSIEKKYGSITIAVIIPVFNELDCIDKCLRQPALSDFDQVITVDGGSSDGTCEKLEELTQFTQINCQIANRAMQMNLGASATKCDILLFLHADTQLPVDAAKLIKNNLKSGTECGCFRRQFTPASTLLMLTSKLAYWRSRLFFWSYGDQALFYSKSLFDKLSGYKELNSFEDLDLCLRAKKMSQHCVINSQIQTSARRFANAPLKVLLKDFTLSLGYLLGFYHPR